MIFFSGPLLNRTSIKVGTPRRRNKVKWRGAAAGVSHRPELQKRVCIASRLCPATYCFHRLPSLLYPASCIAYIKTVILRSTDFEVFNVLRLVSSTLLASCPKAYYIVIITNGLLWADGTQGTVPYPIEYHDDWS